MSGLDASIAEDFEAFDATESVTYVSASAAGDVSAVVEACLRRAIGTDEAGVSGRSSAFRRRRAVFHLPVAQLAGIVPKPGDTLIDTAGVRWRVESAERQTLGTRYAATCVEER